MEPEWRLPMMIGLVAFELGLAIIASVFASDWRSPLLSDHRATALAAFIVSAMAFGANGA